MAWAALTTCPFSASRNADVGVEDDVEENVAVGRGRQVGGLEKDEDGLDAEGPGRRRRLHAPIGLEAGPGDDDVGLLLEHVPDDELELARLVAAEGQARQVVALDVDIGAAQAGREPLELPQRRRAVDEVDAGKPVDPVEDVLGLVGHGRASLR